MQPLSNAFIRPAELDRMERFYPLQAFVCGSCFLVQVDEFESPTDIFSDYAYFSSFSSTWLKSSADYVDRMTKRLSLNGKSLVVEIGSNDGHLLRRFHARGIPVLGIDPAANCAVEAKKHGVQTIVSFFSKTVAEELVSAGNVADLVVANNVLAHIPGLNDFVAGIAILLAEAGVATVEVPHLLKLIEQTEYDTIYHEHFSYFSLYTAQRVFAAHGLQIVDVAELPTHGGSLRMWVRHAGAAPTSERVGAILAREEDAGLTSLEVYRKFSRAVVESKVSLWEFLIEARRSGKSVAAYGAAAKGNTLLNYCGIREDLISYVVDRSPHKQHKYLPGSHIPVLPVEFVMQTRPDYLLILPWNLADEVSAQMSAIREWGGRFATAIPRLRTF